MKTMMLLTLLSVTTTACHIASEENLPSPDQKAAMLDAQEAFAQKNTYATISLRSTEAFDECEGIPTCSSLMEEFGSTLQDLANKNCIPAYACEVCCMNNWTVYVTFYVEPDPAVCVKPVKESDAQVMTY